MREKILDIINSHGQMALTAFKFHIPEASGNYDFYLPVTGVELSNVFLAGRVSHEFIEAMTALQGEKILENKACSLQEILNDGGECYDLPPFHAPCMIYNHPHWLPLMVIKGINYINPLIIK